MSSFDDFTNHYFAPAIFIIGFIGNLFGMFILSRKGLKSKLYMTHVYMYLLASDMLFMITQVPIVNLAQSYPSINPLPRSEFFCKLWMFSDYALDNTSPMIIFYISVERLIAVKFPAKRHILKKHQNVLIFTIVITIVNLIYYIPVYLYYYIDVKVINTTNGTTETLLACKIEDIDNDMVSWMYLTFNCAIPYVLMVCCTLFLCLTIFQSRKRTEANKNIRKDVKFTITSISLNVAFIVLTFPISIANFFGQTFVGTAFKFCNLLFFSSYTVNFYFLVAFNSIIKAEVLRFFRLKPKSASNNTTAKMSTARN